MGPELGMRDGLPHEKHYFCFVLALLMWCGGFRNEALEHGDQVLRVLALLARALGLDTHLFQLELLAIRLSNDGPHSSISSTESLSNFLPFLACIFSNVSLSFLLRTSSRLVHSASFTAF